MVVDRNTKERMFEHLKWCLQRLMLDFQNYLVIYETTLQIYDKQFGLSEHRFIEIEIDVINDFLQYERYLNQLLPIARDKRIDDFESKYKSWLPVVQETIRKDKHAIGNNNKRKLDYVIQRKLKIERSSSFLKTIDDSNDLEKIESPLDFMPGFSFFDFARIFCKLLVDGIIITTPDELFAVMFIITNDSSSPPLNHIDLFTLCIDYNIETDFDKIYRVNSK